MTRKELQEKQIARWLSGFMTKSALKALANMLEEPEKLERIMKKYLIGEQPNHFIQTGDPQPEMTPEVTTATASVEINPLDGWRNDGVQTPPTDKTETGESIMEKTVRLLKAKGLTRASSRDDRYSDWYYNNNLKCYCCDHQKFFPIGWNTITLKMSQSEADSLIADAEKKQATKPNDMVICEKAKDCEKIHCPHRIEHKPEPSCAFQNCTQFKNIQCVSIKSQANPDKQDKTDSVNETDFAKNIKKLHNEMPIYENYQNLLIMYNKSQAKVKNQSRYIQDLQRKVEKLEARIKQINQLTQGAEGA